jgi:hypothetical protein
VSPTPPITTTLKVSHTSQIKLGTPNSFYGNRAQGCAFSHHVSYICCSQGQTMDPIAVILKFHRGLNATTQDRITKSGTDRPRDNNFNGWFKVSHQLDLNHLANEAFNYALQCPAAMSIAPSFTLSMSMCTPFSFTQLAAQSTLTPAFMHAPSRQLHVSLPPEILWMLTTQRCQCHYCSPATGVASLGT